MSGGIDHRKRTLGMNFPPTGGSKFLLWAPLAQKIEIIINDEKSFTPVTGDYGYWNLTTDEIKPGDKYSLRINDFRILADPASLSQPDGVHGPSQAYDLNSFKWNDENWKGLKNDHNVFYELHTGTFSEKGTFEGIAEKIPYLLDLGITAIEIMPVAQFPGHRNWGYDGVYPFAVHNSYGGARNFQKLVELCHNNGLGVVLDVVYNHLGPEGNYLTEFGPYFTDDYKTPWGRAINFDGPWSDGVRFFYIENMLMWFRDFHIDALRLDAVHAIKDFSAKHIIQEMREYADELATFTGRRYLLIGEIDFNSTRYINPAEKGGYGLDMQWCDEFHHALHSFITNEQKGYYSDFGEVWHIVKSLNSAYVYDGIFSPHRLKTFGSKTTCIPGNKFVVFIQNHDHVGNRMLGERIGSLVEFEALKLLAGVMFLSPFVPLLFMGEEYNETNPFLYFTSHSDVELIEKIRKGRSEEFPDFMNVSGIPDPQSDDVFEKSRLSFAIENKNSLLLDYYKELIWFKKNHPVWKDSDRSNVYASQINEFAILFTKILDNSRLMALLNFSNRALTFELPQSDDVIFQILMNSAEKRWGGNQEDHLSVLTGSEIKTEPFSFVVLTDNKAQSYV